MPFNRIESPVQCAFSVSSQARPLIRQESTTTTDIRIFAIFNQGPGTLKVQVSSVSGEPHDVAPNETQNVLVRVDSTATFQAASGTVSGWFAMIGVI